MPIPHVFPSIAVVVAFLACSPQEEGTRGRDADGAAGGRDPGSACALLRVDDLVGVIEGPVEPRARTIRPTETECAYLDPRSEVPWIVLRVIWKGGRAEMARRRTGMELGTDLLEGAVGRPRSDAALEVVTPGPVEGLGDEAWFDALLASVILEGDVLLEFRFPMLTNPGAHFLALGRRALERLP